MNNLIVEVASGPDVIHGLREEWQQLHRESHANPFISWEWMSAWHDSFDTGSESFILEAREGGRLIGLLPLRHSQKGALGTLGRVLTFIGDDHNGADHLDIVARPDDAARVAVAFVEYLSKTATDVLILDNLSPASPLRSALRDTSPDNYIEREGYTCPQVDLSTGWYTVLTSSRRRSNFKRRLRDIETLPGFKFRSRSLPADVAEAFERFLDLHERRWAGRGRSDLSGRAGTTDFHREAVKRMADAGMVRFDELWLAGECVASIYGIDDGRTFYYFNAGFDPDFADKSVGLVLQGLSIRAACDRGRKVYDFLRGDEAYKFDWAGRAEVLINASLVSNTLAGRAIAAREGLKQHARDLSHMLPSAAREQIRTWRHRYTDAAAARIHG